jgi:hypothetical protein
MANKQHEKARSVVQSWTQDWCKFAREALGVNLDKDQEEILRSVQFNPRTTVASGTARGKDFVTAVAAVCFMYLTPKWNKAGEMVANTKVALTAPTDRQVKNIMMPEISRIWQRAKSRGIVLPGRLNVYDIRTDNEEWFLTGFKADEHQHEAWSGFHAVNTMFAITEASGISDDTFGAIEGNLQGNSRILLVFNPNQTVGYAAKSQKGDRWSKFRLNSLTAPNVVEKRQVIPGQVDYDWIVDKLENWCTKIRPDEVDESLDDFEFEGQWYRPEDICRIKILGKFPKVSEDSLIPEQWIELAENRWSEYHSRYGFSPVYSGVLCMGNDIAGMGRDSSVDCYRYENIVSRFFKSNSGGIADHMASAGRIKSVLDSNSKAKSIIDTIGEGAGVFSRLIELGYEDRVFSCKYSEGAYSRFGQDLTDITGQYKFANMRAYLSWCVRDWLNPKNNFNAMLPPGGTLKQEATEIRWQFRSDGKVLIEKKEDIKKRLGFSTDEFDALANTFYPAEQLPEYESDYTALGIFGA